MVSEDCGVGAEARNVPEDDRWGIGGRWSHLWGGSTFPSEAGLADLVETARRAASEERPKPRRRRHPGTDERDRVRSHGPVATSTVVDAGRRPPRSRTSFLLSW